MESAKMILRQFTCFSVLMFLSEGSSVKVPPGGHTTLPCSIKDDEEITWIITNGNQTFIRILKLEYGHGPESKPEHSNTHPSYAGRIKALSSSINTHSLLLMNITDTDLMLYCCTDMLEQSHCTKLDYEEIYNDVDQQDTDISHDPVIISISLWSLFFCCCYWCQVSVCVGEQHDCRKVKVAQELMICTKTGFAIVFRVK